MNLTQPTKEGKRRSRGGKRIQRCKANSARRFSAEVIGHIRDESRGTAVDPRDVAKGAPASSVAGKAPSDGAFVDSDPVHQVTMNAEAPYTAPRVVGPVGPAMHNRVIERKAVPE